MPYVKKVFCILACLSVILPIYFTSSLSARQGPGTCWECAEQQKGKYLCQGGTAGAFKCNQPSADSCTLTGSGCRLQ